MIDYVEAVRRESERFHQAILSCSWDDAVPSCPGWTVADLAWHLSEVQHSWASVVGDLLQEPASIPDIDRPPDDELPALVAHHSARLVEALAGRAPEDDCWSWHDEGRSVGWVRRRQAHEALIHRVDAELAAGEVSPVDEGLAEDGVDELLAVFLDCAKLPDWARFEPNGTTAVIATPERSWEMELGRFAGTSPNTGNTYDDPALLLVRSVASPTALLQGRAADLDLWLWGRGPLDPVAIQGDAAIAAHVRAAAVEGTQ